MPLQPIRSFKGPRLSAATQTSQLNVAPPPVGGLNFRDPINAMPITDAMVLRNLIPNKTGCTLRKGYQYHTTALDEPIVSLFSYNSADGTTNKLFAASDGSIWDVTDEEPVISEEDTGSDEDQWNTTQFANGSGNYLLAVSPGAGYWTYDGTTWTQQSVTNLPDNPTSVAVFKNRVWFTIKDSSSVWYLDTIDAITGTAQEFVMGSLLRNGGYIRGLINWTVDAGVSFDDFLVVVGSEGDLGVWQGTDPSDATKFALKGVWYVGPVPKYGRFFTAYGGDVLIISTLGLVEMSKLVNGQFVNTQQGPSAKIETVLGPIIKQYINDPSFDVQIVADSEVLILKLPPQNNNYIQYVMNVNTASWCTFSNMPMVCTALFSGKLYFATDSYRVAKGLYEELDQVETDGEGGQPIEGEVQVAFNDFGSPGQLKQFVMVKPIFTAPQSPSVKLRMNTQYSFQPVAGSPAFVRDESSYWDEAKWNLATWSSATNTYESWYGIRGLGYYGALRMRMRGFGGTTNFYSYHIMNQIGGVM